MPRQGAKARSAVAAALIIACATSAKAQVRSDEIKANMVVLQPLIGTWRVAATFHARNGDIELDDGTFRIASVLDGSYLQVNATLYRHGHPESAHSFIQLITFNPGTKKYDVTYFYSRSALRVSEQGQFDATSRAFTTTAYILQEDGVRNENVRTAMQILNLHHLKYTHYSRYDNEAAETMDLEMVFTRTG
jgi:hypothetical protein